MLLPDKYQNLIKAKEAGINVPETLFLDKEALDSGCFKSKLNKFIDQNKDEDFIIRSAVIGEDGKNQSLAGHFKSSKKTKPAEVLGVVASLYQDNLKLQKKYAPKGRVGLMIQPFFEQECGGVLFSQWKYFKHHFVGEVNLGGAQKAVEGTGSRFFCFSKNTEYEDVLRVEELDLEVLKPVVKKLEDLFDFPMDIEWGITEGEVIVFQIRPVTRSVQSLTVATEAQIARAKKSLEPTTFTDWQIEAYAESLGVLSPLSFELMLSMYEGALSTFESLGFKAQSANFLTRLPNGQIYASPKAQTQFFILKSWTTPFWQVFNEAKFLQKIQSQARHLESEKPFEEKTLQSLFNAWQIANCYAALKSKKNPISVQTWPGEYELSQLLNLSWPKEKTNMSWADWRNFYKQAWLCELNKLKEKYDQRPLGVFISKQAYKKDLEASLPDFPTQLFEGSLGIQKRTVVKGQIDLAKAFVVKNPKSFTGEFPEGSVLVAPYFSNDWVGDMDQFSGIILEQGGQLSHSAIVAREKSIPYVIGWEGAVEELA